MLFNTLHFIWFFSAVLIIYFWIKSHFWRNKFLLLASYVFYCCWDWRFSFLLLLSTLVNYYLGSKIASSVSQAGKKSFLVTSVCFNLGLLGFFKYSNFFIHSFSALSSLFGVTPDKMTLNIILPLGISFYTFQ